MEVIAGYLFETKDMFKEVFESTNKFNNIIMKKAIVK